MGVKKFIHKKAILCIIGLVVLLVAACVIRFAFSSSVDTAYLSSVLMEASELTTAKLRYTGVVEYKDDGVKFLNRSDFSMIYEATVRAGINMEDVKITADESTKTIFLDIPKAVVQDVKVDASSIKYFDESISLFNFDSKKDSNKAITLAEEAAKEEAGRMGILEMADSQSQNLIKGILANVIPEGYTMQIKK